MMARARLPIVIVLGPVVGSIIALALVLGAADTQAGPAEVGLRSIAEARCPGDCRIMVVSKEGGDTIDPIEAMNFIKADLGSNPGEKWLIWIGPGRFDISEPLTMEPGVDVQGSGEGITFLLYRGGSAIDSSAATVVGANGSELRRLTVESDGDLHGQKAYAIGIFNDGVGGSSKVSDVAVRAFDSATSSYGIYNTNASPTVSNVTATASDGTNAYGIANVVGSNPILTNVTAEASGAEFNYGVRNQNSSPTMRHVTASAVDASAAQNYGVSNSHASPIMEFVTALGADGTANYGIRNGGSTSNLTMRNVVASATGGTNNFALRIDDESTVTMQNVRTLASGGGVFNMSLVVNNATATAANSRFEAGPSGSNRIGVNTDGTAPSLTIIDSTIVGVTAILADSGAVKIGASLIDGLVTKNGGTTTCVHSHDGSYLALDSGCEIP